MKFTKQDFTIAAVYRLFKKGRINTKQTVELLTSRASLKPKKAKQIAEIWAR